MDFCVLSRAEVCASFCVVFCVDSFLVDFALGAIDCADFAFVPKSASNALKSSLRYAPFGLKRVIVSVWILPSCILGYIYCGFCIVDFA